MSTDVEIRRSTDVGAPGSDFGKRGKMTKAPTRIWPLTLALYVLGIGFFGGFGAWAAYGKIQGGVIAGGTFEVAGRLQSVDHLEGGIVEKIHVREGDLVEEGQLLVSLDRTRSDSLMKTLLGQLTGALARQARLKAEARGEAELVMTPELDRLMDVDQSFAAMVETQRELLSNTAVADSGEISIIEERILQAEQRLIGVEHRLEVFQEQLDLISEEARVLEDALEKGLALRTRVISMQQQEMSQKGRISDAMSEQQGILNQIAELKQQQFQIKRQRLQANANEMQLIDSEIVDLKQRVTALTDVIRRLDVRAPASGRIIGFDINTVGAVIDPGDQLMRIVPSDTDFVIRARVGTDDIDEIEMGNETRVRLSAYSFRKVAPVEGTVTYIAADALFDQAAGVPYYEIEVNIEREILEALPGIAIVPGMPVQVMVATGEQTILTHLLDPVVGGLETAFVESD